MSDIATLTGAQAIFKDLGVTLESVKISDLGSAKKVTVTSEDTTIVMGGGSKEAIEGRAEQIRNEIETTTSEYDQEKLQERLAKLAGGVAQIHVGAATETEMKERKMLMEDARAATQAALAEGIVPGGGVALLRSDKALEKLELSGDEALGAKIIENVLDAPLRAIAENAGQDGAVVVNRVRRMKGKADGYDAEKDEYCNLIEAGHCRSGKGGSHRLAERRERGRFAAYDFMPDHRYPQGRRRKRPRWSRAWRRRHGWHGRHGHGWNGRRHGWHGHGRHGRILNNYVSPRLCPGTSFLSWFDAMI